ncbi:Ribosomal RNA small subunit methyltransferase H [Hippea maritima DSM 10411]|uniref:Ribosomal RNA small subunit methyltransferase H n=2 Tax=Hippea TaxID=84404 RepID=F2LW64_HIPMA|nr:16S rRNA (cytosine(1402)-N(4))-methyltransferase RsmH [Hippea maritima]AEA33998.1 Ribosomal RNA small subunit methyltransferase H [Hippea maritima DSM 10411]
MKHKSVLLKETITTLQPRNGGIYIDMTLGAAGHTEKLLKLSSPSGIVIAFDKDQDAIKHAQEKLKETYGDRLILINDDYANIKEHLRRLEIDEVDGVIMDLGVSLDQLKSDRGFSFNIDAPLDMRMDKNKPLTAEKIVNHWDMEELERIIRLYGEENFARRIAKAIVKNRPIHTTKELAELIELTVPRSVSRRIHPATRTFQALRIVVNDELESLQKGLKGAIEALKENGIICAISFHSLEDRIVKNILRDYKQKGVLRLLNKKPIRPTPQEVKSNKHSRSAKLRCALKLTREDSNV